MNVRIPPWVTLTPLLFALWSVSVGHAQEKVSSPPNPFLSQARKLYESLRYEECLLRIGQAGQWKSTPTELVEVEIYGGLCQFALGRRREAEEHFTLALRFDRTAQLPPFSSPKAVSVFERIRAKVATLPPLVMPSATPPAPEKAEPPAQSEARETNDAPREVALTPPVSSAAPSADFVPTAKPRAHRVPQATWYLGGGSLLTAGSAVYFWSRAKHYEGRANAEPIEGRAFELGEQARARAHWAYGSAVVSTGLAAAAAWLYWRSSDEPAP